MGEVVGAGLLAHVPTIVLPEETGANSTTARTRRWCPACTSCAARSSTSSTTTPSWCWTRTGRPPWSSWSPPKSTGPGLFTSEELPRGMSQRPYDFRGDPELAHLIAGKADDHGTWITAIDDPHLPIFYATTNVWEFLGRGLPDKRWISIGVCQTADTEDNLRLGRALGDAIAESDRKVAADRLRRAVATPFGRCASCATTRPPGSSTSSPPRPPRPTSSGSTGSRTVTTRGCWTPCRSSTASSPRPASATT